MKESNKELLEYLDINLYLLITINDKHPNIDLIRHKLKKEEDREIFEKIISGKACTEIAKGCIKLALAEFSHFNPESVKKLNNLEKYKKELDDINDKYIDSIPKEKFLASISEIAFWMAKVELKWHIKIYEQFLREWSSWHVYLEKKNKSKLKGQKIKEKLRVIMGDKIDDYEKIKEYEKIDLQRFKDGKLSISIDLNHDIDTEGMRNDTTYFEPDELRNLDIPYKILKDSYHCIHFMGKKLTLSEYFEVVKKDNLINKNWLKSSLFHKRLLTIYLIKRCQNGDEYALNKLIDLYKESVNRVETKFIKKYKNYIDESNVKGMGLVILNYLLKGDNPSTIYKSLDMNRNEKKELWLLNKKPYETLNNTYEYMFNVIFNEFDYLIKLQDKLNKNTKDYRSRLNITNNKEKKIEYQNKIFNISQDILSRTVGRSTMFELFNPNVFLGISSQYNKYLFKPHKNGNLTTWLLGGKDKIYKGMIWQELSNAYLRRKHEQIESYDESEYYYYSKNGSDIYTKKKTDGNEEEMN